MIRSKKFFTIGSIVSIVIMFASLMFGFIADGYHHSPGYYTYNYYGSYRYPTYVSGHTYWTSFADYYAELFWPLFATVIVYVIFSIVAVALYRKRVLAINIINIVLTNSVYIFAAIVSIVALDCNNITFGLILLIAAVGVAYPLHLFVEVLALIGQKYKRVQSEPDEGTQQPASIESPAAPTNNDAIETLKKLKELYDAGILTEDEYSAKRQQYVNSI